MNTREKLENALKDAMRAHDEQRKSTLRMALSNIRLAEIDRGSPLDEAGVLAILQKEVKSRQESLEDAERANRSDRAAAATAEKEILESFLPQAMPESELRAMAQEAIAEVGATSPREMGQVMKVLLPRLQGRATGNQASQVVRELLQG